MMARFIYILIGFSAILLINSSLATACDDDSSESIEETTSAPPACANNTTTQKPSETTENQTTVSPTLNCGDNEIAIQCPDDCSYNYCPKSRDDGKSPCPQPTECPAPACKCIFNFRRANNGSCIPTRDCPPFPCDGPNEEYNSCPPYCPGEDCSQATPDGKCPIFGTIGIVLECKPACRCKKNYWRLNGLCVPYDQCPNTNDTIVITEEPSTKKPASTKPSIVKPILKCRPFETIDHCPVDCPINNCPKSEDVDFNPCPRPKECGPPACRCGLDTHRIKNGSCVPIQDCPPFECNRPNEEYRACYPVSSSEDCSEAISDEDIDTSTQLTLRCKPTCRCKKNYWRLNGVCVPYKKCKRSECPEHETMVLCKSACSESACPRSEADTEPFACPDVCLGSGCACEPNYSRASDGRCIRTKDCPPFNCTMRPNEMYDACPSPCSSDSCTDIGTIDSCRNQRIIGGCKPACRCLKGFNRNDDGICVPTAECPGGCPPNKEYTNCAQRLCRPQNCTDIGNDQWVFDCEPDKTKACDADCVCKDGYLRLNNVKCSGPYEEYSDSKQRCPGETCAALTSKFICEDETVEPGCVCISGYRRKTTEGQCLPICECQEMIHTPECQAKLNKIVVITHNH